MCAKRKVAVFVEGQTELVFVRELLLKWYDYDSLKVGLECICLRKNKYESSPYPFGDFNSENYYQIVNVGNDNSYGEAKSISSNVASVMMRRAEGLNKVGFQLIVGLRDMYCDLYHKRTMRKIDDAVSQEFIASIRNEISSSKYANIIRINFAIMEVEAWLLGMPQCIHKKLNVFDFSEVYDESCDPEITIYHPAKVVNDIFSLAGKSYGKHIADINSIVSLLGKKDFQDLYDSGKCESFRSFMDALLGADIIN